ncbi:MAG: hypothetical protein AAB319_02455 [Pseudomonadota bacterium]
MLAEMEYFRDLQRLSGDAGESTRYLDPDRMLLLRLDMAISVI